MPSLTSTYNFNLPLVNNAIDANLWGGYLNANWTALDALLSGSTSLTSLSLSSTLSVTGLITATAGVKIPTGQAIYDGNNNELVKFTTTASAVNEITIANAATGSAPVISATGGDAGIPINLQSKGGDPYNFLAGSTGGGTRVRLFEQTTNGSNYIEVKAPDALSGNVNFTLPTGNGSANQALASDGSGNLSYIDVLRATAASLASNGYITLSNGLKLQWGVTGSVTALGSSSVSFPNAFSTAVYSVIITSGTNKSGSQSADYISSLSTTGFNVHNQSGSTAGIFYWFAIGV